MSVYQESKKYIKKFLSDRGFSNTKQTFYRIENDIAYCITFEVGSLIYVVVHIVPLYIPSKRIYLTYGQRLNNITSSGVKAILTTEKGANKTEWLDSFCRCIDDIVLPFFKNISSPEKLIGCLEREKHHINFIRCPNIDLERLKMFTYLYLDDRFKLHLSLESYKSSLEECTFLTESCRQGYLNDVSFVRLLQEKGESSIKEFKADTVKSTTQLFNPNL